MSKSHLSNVYVLDYIFEQRAVSGARGVSVDGRKNGGEGKVVSHYCPVLSCTHTNTYTRREREIHNKQARTTVTEGRVEGEWRVSLHMN